ncbi:MAG TPA: thioesterase domain-containing protein [Chloroflexia bacterium]|nr:thioesterase domain-containing protein [Chloroflexia bacterium]
MRPGTDPWVIFPKPAPLARVRLFCFPYAGGSASIFRSWPAALGPEIELGAIQLPGRERLLAKPPIGHLPSLVEALAQSMQGYADLPFTFYGHSMGALVAFEVARRLHAEGSRGPAHLFLSGHKAPQRPAWLPAIYHLPDEEFIQALRRLDGTPEDVLQNRELLQLLLPALRADFEIVNTYTYVAGPPLDCPISIFRSMQDTEVSQDELEAWREQTTGEFKLRMMPGGHFFLHSAYPAILQAITSDLAPVLKAYG